MSTTLTTSAMVLELQYRFNNTNLDSTFCLGKLNQAYRWIESMGDFVWNEILGNLALSVNSLFVALPAAYNPGKMASITLPGSNLPVAFLPFDEFQKMRSATSSATPGLFGAWTQVFDGTSAWQAVFGPDAAKNPTAQTVFSFMYHRMTPAPLGLGAYFPTPDELDDLILERAEAEIRRIYGFVKADEMMAYVTNRAATALLSYASTKETTEGLQETIRRANEKTAKRA